MNRRRLAALVAHADGGEGPEAEIARTRLADLQASGKVSDADLREVRREIQGECAAPAVDVVEPWRTTIAAAVAIDRGCKSFWRKGAVHFSGAGAADALSDYLRLCADCDAYAHKAFDREVGWVLGIIGALGGDVRGVVRSHLPEAEALWIDMFRSGFSRTLVDRVRGVLPAPLPVDEEGGGRGGSQAKAAKVTEVERAESLAEKVGPERVAVLVGRADYLGAAAGSRAPIRALRRLSECGVRRRGRVRKALGRLFGV